jgi:hypothetical protein
MTAGWLERGAGIETTDMLKVQCEPADDVTCHVLPAQAGRGTLHGGEIKLGVIELVFGKHGEIAVHEIFHAGERIQTNTPIVRAASELI